MPRKPRLQVGDGIFHIATRGVHAEFLYRAVGDRHAFLRILESVTTTYAWRCLAYTLMGTHYHLLIRTRDANLARGMQMLNGRYAQSFNARHGRRGHLFGDRYFSALVDTDAYLRAAHRYIALNPVNAGLADSPTAWRWGSAAAIAGLARPPTFLDVGGALALFDLRRDVASAAFAALIANMPAPPLPYLDALTKYVGV